ncbi:unnamed protein product [Vicia faba]|uniref:CRC domain-containing protein n=1 Tax=Vicia faba TaxID=3906 RepID=A0AAV1APY3_VICFA|nr:unnamed protein product [Vicia faba]
MEAPLLSNLEEGDDSFFNYLNSLSPLNSLAMDSSLFTSPDVTFFEDSTFFIATNNLLDTPNPQVELSSQQAVQYGSCSPQYQQPLISRDDDVDYLLGLLDMQEPYVQDDSIKDLIEGEMYIPEVGQIEANTQVPDCDYDNLITTTQSFIPLPQSTTHTSNYKMQTFDPLASENNLYEPIAATYTNQTWNNLPNFALMDTNPIQTGNVELVRIRHSIWMGLLDYGKTTYTSSITSSCSLKSDERNAIPASNHYGGIESEITFSGRNPELPGCTSSLHLSENHLSQVPASMERHLGPSDNEVPSTKDFTRFLVHITGDDFCWSTLKMKSERLDPSNMKKKRKGQIEKEEESDDFCPNTLKKKRKIHKSGHCQCKKSGCLRKHCECFKGGVGCSPSCKCQGCENIYGRKDREAETKSELEETEAFQILRPLPPLPYLSLC